THGGEPAAGSVDPGRRRGSFRHQSAPDVWPPGCGGLLLNRGPECADARVDVVDDLLGNLLCLAGGVGQVPVQVVLARVDGAGVPATHGDDVVGCPDHVVSQWL